jgi:hypothetical protein
MNVTTVAPVVRRRVALPLVSSIFSLIKKVFSFFFSKPVRIFYFVVAIFAAVGIYTIFFANSSNNGVAGKLLPLKQEFEVVAKTKEGKNTNGKFQLEVVSAHKAESLLIQGQRVIARNNKVFLVVNMEISNSYKVALYNQPVDSFRLIGSDGKRYAPTAHQGNVEVRPESTKTSNVGFVVPEDQKKFKVEVGDLNSDKVILEFSL